MFCLILSVPATGFTKQTNLAEKVAKGLYAAWTKGTRTEAAKYANAQVIKTLFKNSGKNAGWSFQGCEKEKNYWNCNFYYEGGGAFMKVYKKGTAYQVTGMAWVAD
jgi:hypothetical protein